MPNSGNEAKNNSHDDNVFMWGIIVLCVGMDECVVTRCRVGEEGVCNCM